jgi:hypothetical protein
MRFPSCRRLIAMMTAALFMLSAVGHHVAAAGMTADVGMAMQSQLADMAARDMDGPCPMSSDCSKDMDMQAMACFAHCATVLGVLTEPVLIPGTAMAHPLDWPPVHPLASLHGPPESPPPKPLILI